MRSETAKCEKCPYAFRTLVGNDLWDFHCKLGRSPKSCEKENDMETKRYVRTEGGLIVDTQDTFPFMVVGDVIDFNSFGRFKIKRTGDSIEDLCDRFVVYEESGGFAGDHRVYNDLELAKYEADEHTSIVYGAIWTDKGLIYVAEMNGKGELELMW